MKTNIYVLYGGKSVEHEISIISATSVLNSIDKEKYKVLPVFITKDGRWIPYGVIEKNIEDSSILELSTEKSLTESMGSFISSIDRSEKNIVFPVLHGQNGEDGTIQGLLELLDLPYIGNEVLASSLCMDKVLTSHVLKAHDLPQANYTATEKFKWTEDSSSELDSILENISLPVFVKPANAGSSVGVSRAENRDELIKSIELGFIYDTKLLIQEEVVGKEVETCIIGNNYPLASLSGELEMDEDFYDYEAKYIKKAAVPVIPARLNQATSKEVQDIALRAYQVLNCRGLARVDIFVTPENKILINEINTMPGFTSISMAPMLWLETDQSTFDRLIERLISYGFERFEEKSSIAKMKVTK